MSSPWKGNVRELDNALERAMILGNGEWITPVDLPRGEVAHKDVAAEDNLMEALREYEKTHIQRTLEKTAGDKKRASELLGFSVSTLYRKMEKLGIDG